MQETGQKILSLVETQVSSAPNFGSNAINVLRYCCTNHDRVPYSAEPDYSEVNCGGLVHCKGALPTSNEPRRCFKVSRMRPELIVPSASSSWHLFHGKERTRSTNPSSGSCGIVEVWPECSQADPMESISADQTDVSTTISSPMVPLSRLDFTTPCIAKCWQKGVKVCPRG